MNRLPLHLWLLLAAALFMRAVLPQGYMPERSGGEIAVVICGSGGTHLVRVGDDGDGRRQGQRAEPPCAFAGLGAAVYPPPLAADLPVPPRLAVFHADQSVARAAGTGVRLLPPARGPPLPA